MNLESKKTSAKSASITVKLAKYLKDTTLEYLPGVRAVILAGSAARNEDTLYNDEERDILLGNIALVVVVTKTSLKEKWQFARLQKDLNGKELGGFQKGLKKQLVLTKPFELSLFNASKLNGNSVPADIWTYEMVHAGRVLYGDAATLQEFATEFKPDAGFRILLSRLFGLNLCLPLVATDNIKKKIDVLSVNYECVKGLLAVLEALLVLSEKYQPTYAQKEQLIDNTIDVYKSQFNSPKDTRRLLHSASALKLDPRDLEKINPIELWHQTKELIFECFTIYRTQGYTLPDYLKKLTLNHHGQDNISEFLRFASFGKTAPKALIMKNREAKAINLMLKSVSALQRDGFSQRLGLQQLVNDCHRANYLHTFGEWQQIGDHTRVIRP